MKRGVGVRSGFLPLMSEVTVIWLHCMGWKKTIIVYIFTQNPDGVLDGLLNVFCLFFFFDK